MIVRGQPWGSPTFRTEQDLVVSNDIAIARTSPQDRMIVISGDLTHSLGDPPVPLVGAACTEVMIDSMNITLFIDDKTQVQMRAASYVQVGNWLKGDLVLVTNAGFVKGRDIAPRSHPNDGFLDVMKLHATMSSQQRLLALRKSRTGTHIPHPLISTSRVTSLECVRSSSSTSLIVDRVKIQLWNRIVIEIQPDYWRLLV
jgi:hypothetical protein